MFDVIVIGARCAGSPLAMLLARKARFPSDDFFAPDNLYRIVRESSHVGQP